MIQKTRSKSRELKMKGDGSKTSSPMIDLEKKGKEMTVPEKKKGVANTRRRTRSFTAQDLQTCIYSNIDFSAPMIEEIGDISEENS
jgi:hypothetical protein